jgi:hypothetical protein
MYFSLIRVRGKKKFKKGGDPMIKKFRPTIIFMVKFCMLAMILATLAPDFCYAGLKWKSIGPEGGNVRSIAIDPSNSSILYAGTYGGGVFKSIIEEIGDFNGDGRSDILWQHTNGTVGIWLMNGPPTTVTRSSVGYPGGAGSEWQIKP